MAIVVFMRWMKTSSGTHDVETIHGQACFRFLRAVLSSMNKCMSEG